MMCDVHEHMKSKREQIESTLDIEKLIKGDVEDED